jgi:hypothetical protein
VLAIGLALLAAGCGGSDTAGTDTATTEATGAASDPGLPEYTAGYLSWTKLNAEPFTTPGAHNGVKNVYVSATREGDAYPDGAVVVKSIADEGATGPPRDVAVMHKVGGEWEYVEYTLEGDTYGVLAEGSLCQSCHMQAADDDYVFTQG